MTEPYFATTCGRFSFKVGPSSPPGIEKSVGKILNFWTFEALLTARELVALIPLVMYSFQTSHFIASSTVVTLGLTPAASPANTLLKLPSDLGLVLSVINIQLYFLWSPIIMQLDRPWHSVFRLS